MMKTTLILLALLCGSVLHAGNYVTQPNNGSFEYRFKLSDVHLPGHAKMANTYFLRDYFHAVVDFDDDTDMLFIKTDMDILQADLQSKATSAGYTLVFFEKNIVE